MGGMLFSGLMRREHTSFPPDEKIISKPSFWNNIMNRKPSMKARVGLFGIGLAAYWPQFPGLHKRLLGYLKYVEKQLRQWGNVANAGLVDTAPRAQAAGDLFARNNVDLIICYTATYATSSQVLPAVQRRKVPVIVLNLQPTAALDYPKTDTGEWLANCSACCVPEISCAFARANIDFNVVSGMLFDDENAWREIQDWVEAAAVMRKLNYARCGFLGHTYPGMLDLYSDFTMLQSQLGVHTEVLEMEDLKKRVDAVKPREVRAKIEETERIFTIDKSVKPDELEIAARIACGLDRLASDFALDALAYYYRGLDSNEFERLGAGLILGNSLLTARGIPCAGEGDSKNAMAMLIMDSFGAGGSYTEFYAMDFKDEFILMGHDGPGHIAISDRKPILRGLNLYHGKRGRGVSVEFNVKTGPITILGVTQTAQGQLKMLAAEGESIPGLILQIGNTNSRLKYPLGPAEFMTKWCEHGPIHHCALGIGHVTHKLEKLAKLLKLELAVVC
jgi:L-arabinose isomerase